MYIDIIVDFDFMIAFIDITYVMCDINHFFLEIANDEIFYNPSDEYC